MVLSDMGLLANKTPYAVSLGGCFSGIIEDIVTLASCDDICNLRIQMYQRRYLTVSVYEELLDKEPKLTSQEQVNMIIEDALHRGESRMRVIRALIDSFRAIATDRNSCQEIADRIKMQSTKRKHISTIISI